jgi:hypothetical protein
VNEAKQDRLSVKELLVVLPVLGTTLAVTYDVGFFYGLDIAYFTLFSLAEHVVFALQALPFAFGAALIIPAAVIGTRIGRWHGDAKGKEFLSQSPTIEQAQAKIKEIYRSFRRGQVIFCGVVFLIALFGFAVKAYLLGACAVIMGLAAATDSMFPEGYTRREFFVAWFATGLVVASFFLGFQNARGVLEQSVPTHAITLTGQATDLRGRLIRSGDRGLLFFDPATKTTSFLMWSSVKRIQTVK